MNASYTNLFFFKNEKKKTHHNNRKTTYKNNMKTKRIKKPNENTHEKTMGTKEQNARKQRIQKTYEKYAYEKCTIKTSMKKHT